MLGKFYKFKETFFEDTLTLPRLLHSIIAEKMAFEKIVLK